MAFPWTKSRPAGNSSAYSNQDVIVAEGDNDAAMYILRAGTVKVFRRAGVAQKFMGTMDAMCIFGELSMINHEPRSATVIAMSDKVLVYRIENPNLHDVAANPAWAEMLISNLSMLLAKKISSSTFWRWRRSRNCATKWSG
jgi:CRP/FNR family cyclic AMP-dependent transcriptional regulator